MSNAYQDAGVDTEAGEEAVALIQSLQSTALDGIGGFTGLIDVNFLKDYSNPLLATGTDGVGTKIEIAKALDKHDTIGIDLVAMIANDIVTTGAKPLFMTDYIATGKVNPQQIKDIVSGIVRGCEMTGMKLVGGETAEHPGVMNDDDYDLAGAAVGVVEKDEVLGSDKVKAGDVLVALSSSGVHSNGFSLVRKIIKDNKLDLHNTYSLADTLGTTLLTPTTIYVQTCLDLIYKHQSNIHALAHITGGGIAANVARVIPENLTAVIDRSTWQLPAIFSFLQNTANVEVSSMEKTFNQGIGMIAVMDKAAVRETDGMWVCGEVRIRTETDISDSPAKGGKGGAVILQGNYR
jgi:phosphoribosylformylglycinamidine cyclo-ligase